MSALPNIAPKALPAMQVTVRGRVEHMRLHEQHRYTTLAVAASDPYSRPQLVEVRSTRAAKVGEKGEEATVVCQVGGYSRKPYTVVDEDTGEKRQVRPIVLTLDLVE